LGFLMVPPLVGFISEGAGIRIAFAIIGVLAGIMIFLAAGIRQDDREVEEHTEEALL
jgi:fucose permease